MTKTLDYLSHVPSPGQSEAACGNELTYLLLSSLHLSAGWLLLSSQRKHRLLQDAFPPLQAGLGVSPLHFCYPVINRYFLST